MIEFDPTLVHTWLSRCAKRLPEKVALVCGQQRWTYDSLEKYTNRLATALLDTGANQQDRVLIFLDNSAETVISVYGTLKAAGTFVILNDSVKAPKLRYILQNSEASVLITHTNKAKVVTEALQDGQANRKIIWVGPEHKIPKPLAHRSVSWDSIFKNVSGNDLEKPAASSQCIDRDLAALIYTSGSTGGPKGVMSTHHNMISAARSIIQYIGNTDQDIILNVLPLSFDYGLYQVIMAFMFGGTVVLEKSFVYLHKVLQHIPKEKVTGLPIVPTIVAMLLKLRDLGKYDFSSLRYITNTGAVLPVNHIRRLRELMPHVRIFSMFGLTECKRVCYLSPEELDNRPSSVGKAMPNCRVSIVDKDGKEVPPGQTGELIIRGSNVMEGYWKDPELTAKTYRLGRYPGEKILYSGDQFRRDDQGFLYFLGRRDDMIKSRGERISAKEVEKNICGMEGVSEVAVIGVPDEVLGQAIKAFIVPQDHSRLSKSKVQEYCKANVEPFMVPKYVEFRSDLPKTANGKIDKNKLKE